MAKTSLFAALFLFSSVILHADVIHTYRNSDGSSLSLNHQKQGAYYIYSIDLITANDSKRRLLWSEKSLEQLGPSLPDTGLHIAAAWVDENDATILISVPLAMAVLVRVKAPYSETPSATTSLEDGIFTGSGITAETQVTFTSANSFVMTKGDETSIPVEIKPNGELYTQGKPLPRPQRNVIHIQKSTQANSSLSGQPLPPQNASEPKPVATMASTINEEAPISWAHWGVIVVIVAAVGLLRLLISKR